LGEKLGERERRENGEREMEIRKKRNACRGSVSVLLTK